MVLDGTAAGGDQQGRIRSLQGADGIGDRTLLEVLAVDDADRAGDVHALLRAVADHDDLVQDGLLVENDDVGLAFIAGQVDFLVRHSDEADHHGQREVLGEQVEITGHIRGNTLGGTLDHDGCARERLAVPIHDLAPEQGRACLGSCALLRLARDGDTPSVDGPGHVLAGKNLPEDLVDGRVFRRNVDTAREIHFVRVHDHGVILRPVERRNGVTDRHPGQLQVHLLRIRARGERQRAAGEQC